MMGDNTVPRLLTVGSILALLAMPNGDLLAQHDRYAPLVLQLPASTRATGLGNAFVAVRDIESMFYNPALAGFVTGTAASGERFRASTEAVLASSISMGAFGIAVGGQFLHFSTPVFRLEGFPATAAPPVRSNVLSGNGEPGPWASASSVAAGLALSTTYRGLRWGVAAKYVQEQLGDRADAEPAFDFGVAREMGTYILGLSVQNVGPDVRFSSNEAAHLPTRATLGVAAGTYPVGPFDLGAGATVSVLRDGFVSASGGTEWSYSPLEGYNFVARVGVRRPELREQRPLTAGASFTLDRFTLDYAFEDLRGGAAHRLGLRVR